LRHDPSVRRFFAWKIVPLTFLQVPSRRLLNLLPQDALLAAAPGFLPLTVFLDWLFSASSLISFRISSLTKWRPAATSGRARPRRAVECIWSLQLPQRATFLSQGPSLNVLQSATLEAIASPGTQHFPTCSTEEETA